MSIRVLLADDHPVVRAGLRAVLATEPDLEIVGEVSTPDAAVHAAAELSPDVVLMDLQFGVAETGADATRRICAAPGAPAVLVLTNYDSDADILSAVEAGAGGYLLKDSAADELIAAVRAAAAGESALAPTITSRLLARIRSPRPALTPRELDVLVLAAEGLGNAAIAERLFLSEATVKSHLAHVYDKLGVASRSAAVAAARTAGMLR
ncbi:response regulator transcription factor [Microbacterium sp. SORGH_AS_0888]|uniref:response regulator n=1 Tax=Microbacterium sp. SORGH_AS_0888 TaxID=3041791 RepID=UPI002789E156|nr:response regulator transcription factor [Microbacterium sp. SORGH_AS_0888]MDQ1128704.1 DNA-binding NarL/FixJ family response regulator [Microbacterium sp. SORGH_AS_0888]